MHLFGKNKQPVDLDRRPTPYPPGSPEEEEEEEDEDGHSAPGSSFSGIPRLELDNGIDLLAGPPEYTGVDPNHDHFYQLPSSQRQLQSIGNLAALRNAVLNSSTWEDLRHAAQDPIRSRASSDQTHFIRSPADDYYIPSPLSDLTMRAPPPYSAPGSGQRGCSPWRCDRESNHSGSPSAVHVETVTSQRHDRPFWVHTPQSLYQDELAEGTWLESDPGKDKFPIFLKEWPLKLMPKLRFHLLAEHHEGDRIWRLWSSTRKGGCLSPSQLRSKRNSMQRIQNSPRQLAKFSCPVRSTALDERLRRLSVEGTGLWYYGDRIVRYLTVEEPQR